jgi:hypothetical protein
MLDDENKWLTIHNGFYSATGKNPIGSIQIPGFLTQHTVRAYSNSLPAKAEWWLGGRLVHLLGSTAPDFEATRWLVPLRRRTLIRLPELTTEYRLKFEPVNWLTEVALVIEVYTG